MGLVVLVIAVLHCTALHDHCHHPFDLSERLRIMRRHDEKIPPNTKDKCNRDAATKTKTMTSNRHNAVYFYMTLRYLLRTDIQRQQRSSKGQQKEHNPDPTPHRHSTGRTDDRFGLIGGFPLLRYCCRIQVGRRHVQKGKQISSSIEKRSSRTECGELGGRLSRDLRRQSDKGGVDQRQERLGDPQSQTRNGKLSKICHCGKCRGFIV